MLKITLNPHGFKVYMYIIHTYPAYCMYRYIYIVDNRKTLRKYGLHLKVGFQLYTNRNIDHLRHDNERSGYFKISGTVPLLRHDNERSGYFKISGRL